MTSWRSLILWTCSPVPPFSSSIGVSTYPQTHAKQLRTAGTVSTPDLMAAMATTPSLQSSNTRPADQHFEQIRAASDLPSASQVPRKPRADIQERSSSYGAALTASQAANPTGFPPTSYDKRQPGTYRSSKSNKEEGFKVRSPIPSCVCTLSHFLTLACRVFVAKRKACLAGCSQIRRMDSRQLQ